MPPAEWNRMRLMTNSHTCAAWGLGVAAILLSPIIVIFLIPLTIGVGCDIFDLIGETPFALALSAPAAFVLLRLISPHGLTHRLAALFRPRLALNRSSELNYAPKSIS
jgi:hypothetical protein